ncbi:MAG: O-antigen ligase family protein [Actinomycetota bacterium]|nr:O-antigen ligase family protein [Actinomycetota bacterium]
MSLLWRSPWPLLWVAVAYSTFSTRDIDVGPIPGKFIVAVLALAVWLAYRRDAQIPWRLPIIAVGVLLPVLGLAVALVGAATGDPAQALGLRAAAEEASRFVYILLAVPLLDWARSRGSQRDADRLWLWPIAGLALLTWLLYVAYLGGADFDGSGQVGPLQGDIAQDPVTGWFRAFMVTQILFLPGFLLLFARLHVNPRQPVDMALLILLLGAVMISHTRGLWLGLLAGCGTYLLLELARSSRWVRRLPVLPIACVGLVGLLVVLSAPTILGGGEVAPSAESEQSTSVRSEQVPQLLDGFYDNPVVGSGMGAVLPSGYRRSEVVPWSFELAYLQLLFQTGIVGLLLLAWLPVVVLRDTVRRMLADRAGQAAAAAGIAALIGLLLSYASNPYLVTSAGTLALAISVTMCGSSDPQRAASPSAAQPADKP